MYDVMWCMRETCTVARETRKQSEDEGNRGEDACTSGRKIGEVAEGEGEIDRDKR